MAIIVAFQGEPGANSEDAIHQHFGDVDTLPCRTLPDVFEAVEAGRSSHGLVAVENSQAGSINQTFDLLLEHSLQVSGETTLRVHHCLLALPGQTLADIRQVYSHPQALSQCDRFLRDLGAETVAVYDTAGSARMIAEKGLRNAAAIASRRAAERYGLEILVRDIENGAQNYTRFYVVSNEPGGKGPRNKTVLVIATQDRPGDLYWCLGALAYRQINLTKLESRPSRNRLWDYHFYLEMDAHISDDACREAIEELKTKTRFLRVLGSFPANPFPASPLGD